MRRNSIFYLAILLVAAVPYGWANAVPALSIQPGSATAIPGDTVTLDIDISNVSDLYAFQFDLGFDPSVLSATAITEGAFLPGGGSTLFIPGTIDNVVGTIAFTADTLISLLPGVTGSGTLATVQFNASALGTSAITLSNVFLLDSNLNPIDSNVSGGTAHINAAAVPEPSGWATLVAAFACLAMFCRHSQVLPGWRETRRSFCATETRAT